MIKSEIEVLLAPFKTIIANAQKVISKTSTLPILSCIKLEVIGDFLTVKATDLEIEYSASIPIDTQYDYMNMELSICVPAAMLHKVLSSEKTEYIELAATYDPDPVLHIEGKRKYDLSGDTDPGQWPETVEREPWTTGPYYTDLSTVKSLAVAMSTDQTRFILNSMLFNNDHIVATDGRRLHYADNKGALSYTFPEAPGLIIPPAKAKALAEAEAAEAAAGPGEVKEAAAATAAARTAAYEAARTPAYIKAEAAAAEAAHGYMVPDKVIKIITTIRNNKNKLYDKITMQHNAEKTVISLGGHDKITCKNIEGTFPQYLQVIPATTKNSTRIKDTKVLKDFCSACKKIIGGDYSLQLQGGEVSAKSKNAIEGFNMSDSLNVECKTENIDHTVLSINPDYLAGAISDNEVVLRFNTEFTPLLIENADYIAVLMPMRT